MEKIKRNRAQTSQRIINALEDVIAEKGIDGIGINRISEKAGVSKVLIYRYFGGLDGLLTHYIKMGRLFPLLSPATLEQLRPVHENDLSKLWYKQLIHTYRFFRQFPAAFQVLKATVAETSPMADEASAAYDEELARMVGQLAYIKGADYQAVSAIMAGAMSYLTLLSKNNRTIVGINLSTEEGWNRVEDAVRIIYTALNRMAVQSEKVSLEVHQTGVPTNFW
ncbi:TetR/AcrR family transcriptional regulator [Larkinella punicea]|uniref:TetR/AcrR family transcriptional regulator n=1 Tax=Larkinella punicea TaxID=2315727 RepID=A0A368JF70_9BACT|nr:TetR/AcrR family transcriptional regulator [Larkinella punicea]RCR65706.1 TetR/AcrR family transcriptional regulator [Larkinella punicea]